MKNIAKPPRWMGVLFALAATITQAQVPPAPAAAPARVITIAADEWCPYNCSPDDKAKPGYMVEIAQAVLGKAGYTVEYKTMPFQRALQEVLKGGLDGAIAADADTEAEALAAYQKAYPQQPASYANTDILAVTKVSFYTASNNTWTFDPANPEKSIQLLGGKVGIPQGYAYDITPLLKKYNAVVEIGGDAPLEQLLKMVDSGRLQAVIDDDAVITYVAGNIGLSERIRHAGSAGEPLDCFISFNSKRQADVDAFNRGLAELRASGELARILQKYNLKDWKN